ncbi:MAG TPA: GEVED domain-containing protein, partial [Flavobacteriales bacterium]|nr:GEVED domain-containing protein [Flavobacteriales bacterium]
TPVSGTSPTTGYTLRFENTSTLYPSFTTIGPIDLTALAGTTIRLVFTNVSDAVTPFCPIAIDNVTLNYTPATPCSGPPTGGTVPATATPCPNAITTITASGASAGIGISYQWKEFNGVTWVDAIGGSGATTTSYTTPAISTTKQYQLLVICSNGGQSTASNTCTVTPTLSPACYCSGVLPTASSDDGTGLRNVTFNTINNTSNGGPAYTSFTAVQTTVNAGGTYTLSTSVNTAGSFTVFSKAWVDWNQNAVFEGSEEYDLGSATNGNPLVTSLSPLSITVPGNALAGATTMRVRAVYDGTGAPLPCGEQSYSEAEDYTINVVPCTPPTVSLSAVDDCANGQFSVAVNVTSFGSGATANIRYTVNNGAPQFVNGLGLGTTNIGPFAASAVVAVSVNNGPPGCSTSSTQVYTGCPTMITCGNTLAVNHCYQNNDPRTFHFVSSSPFESLTLSFVSGTMDPNDVIRAYSGADNSGSPIASLTGSFANLAGVSGASLSNEIFIEIDSDGSNSCSTGQQTSWLFEVECTPGCVDPDAAVSATTNCGAFNFTVDVEVLTTGDAATTTLRYTVNGGTPTDITGLITSDIQHLGPFNIDDVVNVRLLHESDATCDHNFGNFTDDNTCPALGTTCLSARTVNSYPYTHSATTCGAGNEYGVQCSGFYGGGEDYVYKLIITNPGLYNINLNATGGGTFIGWFLKDNGSCTTDAACLSNATSGGGSAANGSYTFASAGTYYLIIDTWPTPNCSAYTLQITYELCPTPVASAATGITLTQAYANWTGPAGTYLVEYGPTATFSTPGTGASAGTGGTVILNATSPQLMSGLTPGTAYRYFVRHNCGVDGWSANSLETLFTTGAATPVLQSTCAQNKAIVDDGCDTGGILYATFTVSGQPNSLGTNVGLSSVDLIITHTYRSDLTVSLISPAGQEVLLIQGEGADWNNFGNNGNCPNGLFKLIATGQPMANLPAANNAVGSWIPEQPLTGFNSGDPNGTWTLRICDGFAADVGQLRFVQLNFLPIDCLGVLGGTALPGTACNDGNACTSNDTWSAGCACAGTFQDTDADGVCDASDLCPGTAGGAGVNAQGCSCAQVTVDDGDPCTLDQCANGVVTHTFQDADGDGVCDASDACPGTANGAGINAQGCSCAQVTVDDGDPCTVDDCSNGVVTHTYVDTDGDGVCDGNDQCPGTANGAGVNTQGCSCAQVTIDDADPCTLDACTNGVVTHTFQDIDSDGICDANDGCPNDANNDADGDGLCADVDNCPALFGVIGDACDAGPGFVLGNINGNCVCEGVTCSTNLSLSFQTDGVSNVGWEVRTQGNDILVQSGGGIYPQSPGYGLNFCLPDGCFYLVVTDNAGDGFTSNGVQGGYVLRTLDNGVGRVIDNRNNFLSGSTSQLANGEGFCIPMGADRLIFTSCDRFDWRNNEYVVANDNPLVTAQYGNTDASSGYQMWWYDPNGGYSFRRTQYHNTANGLTASPTR